MSNWAPEWKAITREERKKFLSEFSSGLKAPPKPRGPLRFTDPVTGTVHEYHWPKRNLKHQPSLVAKFLKFLVIDTWPWDEEDALYFLKTHGVEVVDERPILRTLCLR